MYGELTKDGYLATEEAPANKVDDKSAAKVSKYRELEKKYASLKAQLKDAQEIAKEAAVYVMSLEDKLLQVGEFGITFNDEGVLIAPTESDNS